MSSKLLTRWITNSGACTIPLTSKLFDTSNHTTPSFKTSCHPVSTRDRRMTLGTCLSTRHPCPEFLRRQKFMHAFVQHRRAELFEDLNIEFKKRFLRRL